MKPLELQTIERLWQPLLRDLAAELVAVGDELQIWCPAGEVHVGRDRRGRLPATRLPADLGTEAQRTMAGRYWWSVPVVGGPWLVSLKCPAGTTAAVVVGGPMHERLESMSRLLRLEGLLNLLVSTLEQVVNEEPGHWNRVRHLAVNLGIELGLDDAHLFDLEVAALVHDIGKAQLPPDLLRQQAPLTLAQRQQLASHALLGAALVRNLPGMARVAELVAAHHEAPDGSGYPYGLSGDHVSLSAMIIGVADAFDAMTHHRPYAQPHTYRETIAALAEPPGRFSGRVLQTLTKMLCQWGMLDSQPPVPEPETPGQDPVARPASDF